MDGACECCAALFAFLVFVDCHHVAVYHNLNSSNGSKAKEERRKDRLSGDMILCNQTIGGEKGRSPSINNFDGIVFFVEFHQILFFSIRILFVSEPQMGVTHFFEAHNAYAHICEQNAIGRKSRKNDVKISIESLNLNVARVDCIAIFFPLQS